jgi:hypothetical protein
VGEMFWARVPWGAGGMGGMGGEGEGGGGRGARACVRACTRRLTCPLLPNANPPHATTTTQHLDAPSSFSQEVQQICFRLPNWNW